MNSTLLACGKLIGILGVLLMVGSVAARLLGHWTVGNFATGTLMLAGIGAVSVACFLLLWVAAERGQRS